MHIRFATQDDLTSIVAIYNASIPSRLATADTQAVTVSSRQAWFDAHHSKRPLWVAEQDDVICGWISLNDFYGRPAFHATVELSIYLDPQYHGQGLGNRLVSHAIQQAPSLGITTIMGYVFSHNQGSCQLLSKHGFERWGVLPDIAEMDNRIHSLDIWGRKIS